MLDEELIDEIRASMKELDPIFISSVSQLNITQLKDKIWSNLN